MVDTIAQRKVKHQISALEQATRTSYSGADIRAYARLYDGGGSLQRRIGEIDKEIKDLENEKIRVGDLGASSLEKLSNPRQRSEIETRFGDRLDDLESQIDKLGVESIRLSQNLSNQNFSLIGLTELQTISYSIFREKRPVRSFGAVYPKGWTRGARSIAGSMIFTVFHEHVLAKLLLAGSALNDTKDTRNALTTALSDQIPPFDVQIHFANELGDQSIMVIYGVEFVNEGQTMSIEDLLLETTFQFVAQDIDPMRQTAERTVDPTTLVGTPTQVQSATSLLKNPNVQDFIRRANPFDNPILRQTTGRPD